MGAGGRSGRVLGAGCAPTPARGQKADDQQQDGQDGQADAASAQQGCEGAVGPAVVELEIARVGDLQDVAERVVAPGDGGDDAGDDGQNEGDQREEAVVAVTGGSGGALDLLLELVDPRVEAGLSLLEHVDARGVLVDRGPELCPLLVGVGLVDVDRRPVGAERGFELSLGDEVIRVQAVEPRHVVLELADSGAEFSELGENPLEVVAVALELQTKLLVFGRCVLVVRFSIRNVFPQLALVGFDGAVHLLAGHF